MGFLNSYLYICQLTGFDWRDRDAARRYLNAQEKALADVRDMPPDLKRITTYYQRLQQYLDEENERR